MARFTASYSDFTARLVEVDSLIEMAIAKEREDPLGLSQEINALCRGAVVLLSSHVEAYVRDVGELALDSLFARQIDRRKLPARTFYHISKDLIDQIKDTADHDGIAKKVFSLIDDDGDYWGKTGPFSKQVSASRFNKGFSNPTFDKVATYFNRFGYDQFQRDFTGLLRANANVTKNMLNQLVQTRNNIAHGDFTATKTPNDMKEMARIITNCCRATDKVFADWWKKTHCAIR